jgi:hypothetical protein
VPWNMGSCSCWWAPCEVTCTGAHSSLPLTQSKLTSGLSDSTVTNHVLMLTPLRFQ